MNDFAKLFTIALLVLFLGVLASPVFYNVVSGKATYKPDPKLPPRFSAQENPCVAEKEVMIANHMSLLNEWRDEVVRSGSRLFVAENGKEYEMSLSEGCMKCHSNKADFCDQCHNYTDVSPYCWDCHVEPKENSNGR